MGFGYDMGMGGYGGGMGMGMGYGRPGTQDPTMMIVMSICFACVLSLMLGGVGYLQGWFKTGTSDTAPPAIDYSAMDTSMDASTMDTSMDTTVEDTGSYYQGLPTACALSYKPAKDAYNAAVPPFDPNACQGQELEANCQYWQSVQQSAQNWVWQKTGNVDGCVPVPPGAQAVGSPFLPPPAAASPAEGGTASPASAATGAKAAAGGSKVIGRGWRASQRQARARAGGRTAALKKTTPKKKAVRATPKKTTTRKTTRRKAGSPPAPYATPAFSGPAPFSNNSVAYTMF